MSTQNYRRLLTNLPSMASIVNSFQSPQVQLEVYHLLIKELSDGALESRPPSQRSRESDVIPVPQESEPLTHDLVDGDSIHADPDE